MRLTPLILLLSSSAYAGGGSVEGVLTVKRDGQPAFVRNALVYIRGYKSKPPKDPEKLAQSGRAFDKVVVPVVLNGAVEFSNEELEEKIYHHVFAPGPKTKFQSEKYRPKDKPFRTKPLSIEGPVTVFCDIHKEMISTVYVVPNDRYKLLSTAEGDSAPFRIDGIEPGRWTIVAWHRSANDPIELPIEIKEGQVTKINLTLDGVSGVEQKLINHKRRDSADYAPHKADGGALGEAVGLEDVWK